MFLDAWSVFLVIRVGALVFRVGGGPPDVIIDITTSTSQLFVGAASVERGIHRSWRSTGTYHRHWQVFESSSTTRVVWQ
jgi:hypothetical protein